MRQRAWTLLLAAWLLCLALSGCSFAPFDASNLMSPPKVNEDQQAIYALLQGERQEIQFVYPKSGQYRSAILMEDLTGDGEEEVIGFTALEDGGVQVQFLTKREGRWESLAAFPNTALQVDRVLFGRLTAENRACALIGWGSSAGSTGRTASVSAYLYHGGEIAEYPLGVYGEMTLTDLDGDGVEEVFTVDMALSAEVEGEQGTPAQASVYAWREGEMREIWRTGADDTVTSYVQALFTALNDKRSGVVLDGVQADGSVTTQIYTVEDGELRLDAPAVYFRPSSAPLLCRDLDGDGCVELPRVSLLPGLSEEPSPDSTSYLVEWFSYRAPTRDLLVARALMNTAESYWFPVPYPLKERITAQNDTARRAVTYSLVTSQDGETLMDGPLFTVRTFPRAAWEGRGEGSGFEALAAQNDVVYGIQVHTKDEDLLAYVETVKEEFHLLSE